MVGLFGKRFLGKAFEKTVKAIEARDSGSTGSGRRRQLATTQVRSPRLRRRSRPCATTRRRGLH